jgi:hypothetical protein
MDQDTPLKQVADYAVRQLMKSSLRQAVSVRPGTEDAMFADVLAGIFRREKNVDLEIFKVVAAFCGLGLLGSFVALSYGLDLSPGFF